MKLKGWIQSVTAAWLLGALPVLADAQISVDISVNTPPPELPVYDQPPIPDDGYVWTPGYWAWSSDDRDYFWVPGTWVEAPQPEYLWTPGYWGAEGGAFLWHAGYWGTQVGFYGGVNYGYGYGGRGYEGGYWQGGHLYYNRSVVNVGSTHITNVYNKTVINNITVNHVSYNGGNGGVQAQATASEAAAGRERHIEATSAQQQHVQQARGNPQLRLSENKGRPAIAATPRVGAFSGAGVVSAGHGGNAAQVAQPNRQSIQPRQTQPSADRQRSVQEPAPHPVQTPVQAPRAPVSQPARVNQPQPEQRPQPMREPQTRPPEQVTQPRPQQQQAQQQQPQPQPQPQPQHQQQPQQQPHPEPRAPAPAQQHPETHAPVPHEDPREHH